MSQDGVARNRARLIADLALSANEGPVSWAG